MNSKVTDIELEKLLDDIRGYTLNENPQGLKKKIYKSKPFCFEAIMFGFARIAAGTLCKHLSCGYKKPIWKGDSKSRQVPCKGQLVWIAKNELSNPDTELSLLVVKLHVVHNNEFYASHAVFDCTAETWWPNWWSCSGPNMLMESKRKFDFKVQDIWNLKTVQSRISIQ